MYIQLLNVVYSTNKCVYNCVCMYNSWFLRIIYRKDRSPFWLGQRILCVADETEAPQTREWCHICLTYTIFTFNRTSDTFWSLNGRKLGCPKFQVHLHIDHQSPVLHPHNDWRTWFLAHSLTLCWRKMLVWRPGQLRNGPLLGCFTWCLMILRKLLISMVSTWVSWLT